MRSSLENIERIHVGLLFVCAGFALATGWLSAGSLLLGGAVMGLNFWLMHRLFDRLFQPGESARALTVVLLATMKFLSFLGLVGLLFWKVDLDGIAFAVGATVLLLACVVETLRPRPVIPWEI